MRRPTPKARLVTFRPGAAWARLYSLRSTRRCTQRTVFSSNPWATISGALKLSSTYNRKIASSTSYGGRVSWSFWFGRSSALGGFSMVDSCIIWRLPACEDAAARRKLTGHGNAGDVISADRVHRNRRDNGGINSAAQSEHGAFETALGQIVTQTQTQGRIKFLDNIGRGDLRTRRTLGIDDDAGLFEPG